MGKTVTTTYFCDRCGGKLEKECGLIIEGMTFTASGYDPRGSGGASHSNKEMCYDCSKQFYDWFFKNGPLPAPKPSPITEGEK